MDNTNMMVSTDRLQLYPFSINELMMIEKWCQDTPRLGSKRHQLKVGEIKFDSHTLDGAVVGAISKKIEKMKMVSINNHPWYTYWGILLPETSTCIGLIGYKGYPNENGYTEVGYGLSPNHRRKGYMSEALSGVTRWAFCHDYCQGITACNVLIDNLGSQLVLENNAFCLTSKSDEVYNYILLKSDLKEE